MQFINDDRGVSEVIGAILVFGILIALLSIMQTQAIPIANEKVEFNHNQEVQSNLVEFQETSSAVSTDGVPRSTKIQLGTTYPARMLFFNPRPPAGTLRTEDMPNAEITGVRATDLTIRKFFSGDRQLPTHRVAYEPNYNEYRSSPVTVMEYGLLYNDFGEQQLIVNEGAVVSGNSISLTLFGGNYSRTTSSAVSLEARPTSAPARTVNVEAVPGENITLQLPTRLSKQKWEQLLGSEPNVVGISKSGGTVVIDLDDSVSYSLRMYKIGLGSNIDQPEPKYIVPTGGLGPSTVGIQSNSLPFEVRDRYNNPADGETVNITVSKGTFANGNQSVTAQTNTNGRPNVQYTATTAGRVTVQASFNGDPSNSRTFDPINDPADLEFQMVVDPTSDVQDPEILSTDDDASRQDYTVCGSEGLGSITCAVGGNRLRYSQVTVDYDLKENGAAGLDLMRIEIRDSSDNVLMTDALAISGPTASGTYRSPQIFRGDGTPAKVCLIVTDRAGNSDTTSPCLSLP